MFIKSLNIKKPSRKQISISVKSLTPTILAISLSHALALPLGGNVQSGDASIVVQNKQMIIKQQSDKAIIDWKSFNIGSQESVNFQQPNSQSVVLNRIYDSNRSVISGKLNANGRVLLVNTSGLVFSESAQVDVAGLIASTLPISEQDFLSNHMIFNGHGGSVINRGSINAKDGGFVALLGGQVSNQGIVHAQLGTVALASGDKVRLDFAGDGLLSVVVDKGTINALAENKNLIQADGGHVLLTAKAADQLVKAVVNNTGVIEARNIQQKDGRIFLLADMQNGEVNVDGRLDASAPNGGNGGFIETSAANVKIADSALVTTKATNGKTGTWLIDPNDFRIAATGGNISGITLSTSLGTTDIVFDTRNAGTPGGVGNIYVDDAVSWLSGNKLTLKAENNIYINANIAVNGAGSLSLEHSTASGKGYFLGQGGKISLPGAGSSFQVNTQTYTLIRNVSDFNQINTNLAGLYALASDVDFTSASFVPLANGSTPFTGSFDGLGNAILNLTINRTGRAALFNQINTNAELRNITLSNVNITGTAETAGLVAYMQGGSITNSFVSGNISSNGNTVDDDAGGLVGVMLNGSVTNSSSSAVVYSDDDAGGLVGSMANGNLDTVFATGNVSAANGLYANAGGLVGHQTGGNITKSYATGNVDASNADDVKAGGLVGLGGDGHSNISQAQRGGTITKSYATGNVRANGISLADAGGLVGRQVGQSVIESYATGDVIANANDYASAGGLIGDARLTTLQNVYATGRVSANGSNAKAGGLVGFQVGGAIQSAYAAGSIITGGTFARKGGLVGMSSLDGSTANSYWNTSTSGTTTDDAGAIGLSDTQMQQQASFNAWDFNTVWKIYEGHTAPLLKTFLKQANANVLAGASKTYDGTTNYNDANKTQITSPSGTVDMSKIFGLGNYKGVGRNAGSYTITSDLWSNQQGYDINFTSGTLVVNPKTITVTYTADNKVYDGQTAAVVNASANGVISGDVVNFTQNANFVNANAGTNKLVNINNISLDNTNYTPSSTTATAFADINPKIIAAIYTANNKVYDGQTTAVVNASANGVISGDVVNFTQNANFVDANVDVEKSVIVSNIALDNSNYALSETTSVALADITPAELKVTAEDKVHFLNGNAYAGPYTVKYDGFVNGENESVLSGAPQYTGQSQTATELGKYDIKVSGFNSNNYNIQYVEGNLEILVGPVSDQQRGADPSSAASTPPPKPGSSCS